MKKKQSPCRLCGLPVTWTIENPRRVCTACGEVNLPGDEAPLVPPVRAPPPVRSAERPQPLRTPVTVVVTFVLTLVPMPLAALLVNVLGHRVPLENSALAALGGRVVTVLGLYFFGRTRTPSERTALAITAPITLFVGLPVWWYVGLRVLLWNWR